MIREDMCHLSLYDVLWALGLFSSFLATEGERQVIAEGQGREGRVTVSATVFLDA